LFHELTHAFFRERTGSDRPFWLNEGFAELAGRVARGQAGLTRSERETLHQRIEDQAWISLRRLARDFGGLQGADARAAYLISAAAAALVTRHTDVTGRTRLLDRLGAGIRDDVALREGVGLDTEALDATVRAEIWQEFPNPLPTESGGP